MRQVRERKVYTRWVAGQRRETERRQKRQGRERKVYSRWVA